jgi:hypothetical protein
MAWSSSKSKPDIPPAPCNIDRCLHPHLVKRGKSRPVRSNIEKVSLWRRSARGFDPGTAYGMVHGSRFTVHGSRFTVHGSRFTVHGSRCMVHSSRFTVHGSRFTVHGSRYMVHGAWFTVHGSRLWFTFIVHVHSSRCMVHGA